MTPPPLWAASPAFAHTPHRISHPRLASTAPPSVLTPAHPATWQFHHSRYALWSLSLSIDETNQKTLLEDHAVDPLVQSLSSFEAQARQQAAAAIARLANGNTAAQKEITKRPAIAALINIVKGGGSAKALRLAASAVGASKAPGEPSSSQAKTAAGEVEEGSAISAEDSTSAPLQVAAPVALSETPAEETIVDLNDPSVDLLDGMEARQHAAKALADLAAVAKKHIVDAGAIIPLVNLLKEGDNLGKAFAAAALDKLATKPDAKRNARQAAASQAWVEDIPIQIAAAGAIVPLVEMLGGKCGDDAQEAAAGALFALADEVNNRVAITDAGGVGPLVTLLGSNNGDTQSHAKGVLVRLSIEPANRALIIKKLVDMLRPEGSSGQEGSSAQEQAAAAIANLASESSENRVSIVDAGGIEPLLGLLESPSAKAKENSMTA